MLPGFDRRRIVSRATWSNSASSSAIKARRMALMREATSVKHFCPSFGLAVDIGPAIFVREVLEWQCLGMKRTM
jgi:hypothetical protein